MIKIFVYAADQQLAAQTVQRLKDAGAEHAEALANLELSTRQPRVNRYLFICEPPAEKLGQLVPQVLPEEDYAQTLAQWFEIQYRIVKTAETHKKRAILLSSEQLANLSELLETINNAWGLSLKPTDNAASSSEEVPNQAQEPLLGYLVQNLIEQTPPLQALQNLINALAGIENEPLHETDALRGYRGLLQQHKELQTQNQTLANAQAALNTQLKDATEESELLLNQLHTVQEELERIFLEAKDFKESAAKEKTDLTAERDAQAKANKEAAEEADLLLNQLHQVQEELENYFVKFKEGETQIANSESRWQKVLAKYPDYFDYNSIHATQKPKEPTTWQWRIQGLECAHLNRRTIEFETFIEAGVLGFRFHKKINSNESSLLQWPDAAKEFEVLECIPVGKGVEKVLRAKVLKQLSATDWRLIQMLPKVIDQAIEGKDVDLGSEEVLTTALHKFTSLVERLPEALRYDDVVLKNNQVNPDYEHIWFALQNMSFGDRFWPKFEIRLGAANLQKNGFSIHPKLEVPLIDGQEKPFDSWFEESVDDLGPKFEIRFDISKDLCDQSIWSELSTPDKNLLKHIAMLNPVFIDRVINRGASLSRPAEQWQGLAKKCVRVLSNH